MKKIVHVEGMGCQNCVKHVHEALDTLKGTEDITVSLEAGTAEFTSTRDISDSAIKEVIEEAGYTVSSIETA